MRRIIGIIIFIIVGLLAIGAGVTKSTLSNRQDVPAAQEKALPPSAQGTPTDGPSTQPLRDELAFQRFQELVREFDK